MPKRSTKNFVVPDEKSFEGDTNFNNNEFASFEERIEFEKKRDISPVLKELARLKNKSFADVGEAILKKIHPLYWKVLAQGIFDIKYTGLNATADKLSEIYTNFSLDGRFQFQKGHMWTLTIYLPQETKHVKKAKK